MHSQVEFQNDQDLRRTYVRQRPLHWFIILISYLFIFLLVLESVAFILLGAWHLSVPRLRDVSAFSPPIYRRELGFGILLVIMGSLGLLVSIIGIIATITLRLVVFRIYTSFLWLLMILGIIIGIIGIIFASQVDGFMHADQMTNSNLVPTIYYTEKFLLGMNGGLTLFMSLTMLIGIIIVHCLTSDVDYYKNNHSYVRSK